VVDSDSVTLMPASLAVAVLLLQLLKKLVHL
jgi:hypothetical protein